MTKPWEKTYSVPAKPWERTREVEKTLPEMRTEQRLADIVHTPRLHAATREQQSQLEARERRAQGAGYQESVRQRAPGPNMPDVAASTAAGITESAQDPLYGALDLAGVDVQNPPPMASVLSQARRQQARETTEELADENVGGVIGNVIGEGSQIALPAAKYIQATSRVGKAGGYGLPLAIEAATATGRRGLITPEEGDTRSGNMTKEMLINLSAGGAGAGLLKLARGVNLKRGAQELIDEGIPLTPGQAAKSPAIHGLETTASVTPLLARGTRRARERAEAAISPVIISRVAKQFDDTADITRGGWEGMEDLTVIVNTKYDDAWDAANTSMWNNQQRERFGNRLTRESRRWTDTQGASLNRLADDMLNVDLTVKRLDTKMRDMIQSSNDYEFTAYLKDQRALLRERAGATTNKALTDLDTNYGDFLTIQRGTANAPGGAAGQVEPEGLRQSVQSVSATQPRSVGEAPLQQTADTLVRLMADEGGAPLDFFRRLANVAPTPATDKFMDRMGRAVIGQTNPQRAVREFLADNPDAARYFITASGAAGGADQ